MNDTIIQIPLDDLHESPFNPRKVFHADELQSLADDIAAQGRVLQPLLVRPRIPPLFGNDHEAITGHEIVFGHRRYRAAALAGLATVPCMVRAMTDDEARAAQISENLSRQDVHPIEEAEGFQALLDSSSHTADEIAAQFGKSRSYVYGRLKLLQACPTIRHACLAGEIGSEVALLIARLRTPKLQEKALQAIGSACADMKDGGAKSYRQIRQLLAEKFTLDLGKAMFDREDEMLLPSAGNCVTCPKRAANAPEFADLVEERKNRYGGRPLLGNADTCTDPDCFDAKKKAHLQREAGKLEAAGKVVVQGNAARAAISVTGQVKGGYVAVADMRPGHKKAKGAELLTVVQIQDPRTGKVVPVYKLVELEQTGLAPKAGDAKASGNSNEDYNAQHRRAVAKAALVTAARLRLFKRVREARNSSVRGVDELRAIASTLLDLIEDSDEFAFLVAVWGVPTDTGMRALVATMHADDLTSFILDCTVLDHCVASPYGQGREPQALLDACALYGIDADAVRAEPDESAPTPAMAARADQEAEAGA